jgi:hypothetical protein
MSGSKKKRRYRPADYHLRDCGRINVPRGSNAVNYVTGHKKSPLYKRRTVTPLRIIVGAKVRIIFKPANFFLKKNSAVNLSD